MSEELLKRGLPKWPKMYVTGKQITEDQAKAIIRRTDMFFAWPSGNDKAWVEYVCKLLKYPSTDHAQRLEEEKMMTEEERLKVYRLESKKRRAWEKAWGVIHGNYIHNTWISSSFIDGPHGWCHPDGKIGYVDNVGKWPSVGDIYEEWKKLAKEFSILDIGVTLMDRESCEPDPQKIVSLRILNGEVTLIDPASQDVHEGHEPAVRGNRFDRMTDEARWTMRMAFRDSERGIPESWIHEWAKAYGPIVEEATSKVTLEGDDDDG